MKVFFDTNVLVSAFATRGLCADVLNLVLAEHELVVGETVLDELREVLTSKLRISSDVADEAVAFLRGQAIVIRDAPLLDVTLRDATDMPILSEAVAAEADVLVTGDRDLLEVDKPVPVRILSPRGFWEDLRSGSAP